MRAYYLKKGNWKPEIRGEINRTALAPTYIPNFHTCLLCIKVQKKNSHLRKIQAIRKVVFNYCLLEKSVRIRGVRVEVEQG